MYSPEVLHEITKRVVRIGFIIASADGLSDDEKNHLVKFAKKRSHHLSDQEIHAELESGSKGIASLTPDDIAILKTLTHTELGKVLNEIVHQVSDDKGNLSESEVKALNGVWKALA
jgi:hypothetical protein